MVRITNLEKGYHLPTPLLHLHSYSLAERSCVLESGQRGATNVPETRFYRFQILTKLGYLNEILEWSEHFGISIFQFSTLELVYIDPHIAIYGRNNFRGQLWNPLGVVRVP